MNLCTLTEIRCPAEKPHGIYKCCGSLLGGVAEDSTAVLRCTNCGTWWEVITHSGTITTMNKLPFKSKINFTKQIKVVA